MHANALALTRQCFEAINIIELGICGHANAEATLLKWDADNLTPGKLRAWLQADVWAQYGPGLWDEPWSTFMREFAALSNPMPTMAEASRSGSFASITFPMRQSRTRN